MLSEILETIKKNIFLISSIILISLLSFQLGRISNSSSQPIRIERAGIQEIFSEQNSKTGDNSESRVVEEIDFRVVVSKNSNKYHFLWCPGAKQIKEKNKVYFNTEQEAINAGYILAGNCSK